MRGHLYSNYRGKLNTFPPNASVVFLVCSELHSKQHDSKDLTAFILTLRVTVHHQMEV